MADAAGGTSVSPGDPDPRIYFAAERTLLAWLRTGIAVIGLGFVVARFGLFLRLISEQHSEPADNYSMSTIIGVALILLGAMTTTAAAVQHRIWCQTLPEDQMPRRYWIGLGIWFAHVLAGIGVVLALYLVAQGRAR